MGPGLIAARVATFSLSGALTLLRGAIIRTGIGALIVGAGELIYWFGQLVQGAGGFGAALELMGKVARAVWDGIKATLGSFVDDFRALRADIEAIWLRLMAFLSNRWADFLGTIGPTFNAVADLDASAFRGAGSVIDLLRDRAFTASGLGSFASGWFTFGTVEWTSGANAGRRAEIIAHDLTDGIAMLTLLEAPVRAIADGDAFTIRAGCDKRMETCAAKFANVVNFRGFPHIPGQDAVLRYATKGGGHDGSVL